MKFTARMDAKEFGDRPAADYEIEVVRCGGDRPELRIEFRYRNGHRQRGGELRLPTNSARWLGQALIAAAADAVTECTLKFEVRGDPEIS